jgi:iron(II)-dependent oxidoreductase
VSPANAETQPPGGVDALLKERYRELLGEARSRTNALVEPVEEADLDRVHDPLMSPLVWDLGHIAAFEDLWAGQRAGGLRPLRPDLAEVYDATETPRASRGDVPYLKAGEVREFMAAVRERALAVLERSDVSERAGPLTRGGLVWEMLVQHEHQHNETMLQTLGQAEPGVYRPHRRAEAPVAEPPSEAMVRVEAGSFVMGSAGERFSYDNERPAHEVHVGAFEVDRNPVTNGAYAEFVERGGYHRRAWWSDEGWSWRAEAAVDRPLRWTADGCERRFERIAPLDSARPVMHVSWYEADAYARSVGKRLPTEAEWEKAAAWDASAGRSLLLPWGDDGAWRDRANLDQTAFGPSPAGAHPEGASPSGALGMVGDAWEWTASDFLPYPGFQAFPYREYSEVFFGPDYKVLRGGSWATRAHSIRNTFRNWDLAERRQIHAGFRCAANG